MTEKKIFLLEAEDMEVLAEMIAAKLSVKMGLSSLNARAEENELISTKEACRILACCERTLQRYRAARLVTIVYRGPHRCYYYRDEIMSLREANTRSNRNDK